MFSEDEVTINMNAFFERYEKAISRAALAEFENNQLRAKVLPLEKKVAELEGKNIYIEGRLAGRREKIEGEK